MMVIHLTSASDMEHCIAPHWNRFTCQCDLLAVKVNLVSEKSQSQPGLLRRCITSLCARHTMPALPKWGQLILKVTVCATVWQRQRGWVFGIVCLPNISKLHVTRRLPDAVLINQRQSTAVDEQEYGLPDLLIRKTPHPRAKSQELYSVTPMANCITA